MGSSFDIVAQGAVAWATAHYVLAFIVVVFALVIVGNTVRVTFALVKVIVRGWPPAHLDADGDANPNWEPPEGAAIGDMSVWRGGPAYVLVGEKDGSDLGMKPGPVRLYRTQG